MADPPPDVTLHTRLLPSGETQSVPVEAGKHYELVVSVEGDEDPQAMTPEASGAEGGVSLPKLGEKFSVNPVMGSATGSIAFPIPPGRTLTPGLGLCYDSNGENGPFGLGWALSVPYFQRATTRPHLLQSARGVPTYDDASESDVFVFSDAAELVKVGTSEGVDGYAITRYKARLEGGFARIERWEKDEVSHWRVTSGSNVVSIFGFDAVSRVADPEDPRRVFRWNLSAQIDPLGNTTVYQYVTDTEVEPGRAAGCQSVLVRVLYANREPVAFPAASQGEMEALVGGAPEDYLFEVLFDWGPGLGSGEEAQDDPGEWLVRPDPFSSGRAGFEVRTRRLCCGVRVLHRLGGQLLLASRTELSYDANEVATRLTEVEHVGIDDEGKELAAPPRTFVYTEHAIDPKTRTLPAFDGLDLSKRLTDAEFIDLDGRAAAGLLVRHLGSFTFHRRIDAKTNAPPESLTFGVSASDSADPHRQRFFDLDLDGRPALVELGPGGVGQVWERNADDDGWAAGVTLPSVPPETDTDPQTGFPRVLWGDLDGDGRTDALVVPDEGVPPEVWRYEGLERGWEPSEAPPIPAGVEGVLGDPDACVLLVDVSGDGLPDLLHLEQGAATLYPGLGHGRFGDAVSLPVPSTTLPTRDGVAGEAIDPRRIRAFDVQGTGGVDILVLGEGTATLWLNESGNGFVARQGFAIPPFEQLGLSSLCRIEGRGTGSFVFAKKEANATVTAVDFFAEAGRVRPMLLESEENGIGLKTTLTYAPSTALLPSPDEASPIGRLPYCVPVVTEVETYDEVAELYFSSTFVYRHGCWDPREREFRGFGFTEQGDAQDSALLAAKAKARSGKKTSKRQSHAIEDALPRTFTRSWFHTGIVPPGGASLGELYATEYNQDYDPSVVSLPEPGAGDPEVARALKGMLLRSESYVEVRPSVEAGNDTEAKAAAEEIAKRPVSISVHGYAVKTVDSGDEHRCLLTVAEQSLSYSYERQETPDPRVRHSAVLEVDAFGVALKSIDVAYPRRQAVPEPTVPPGPGPGPNPKPDGEETGVRVRLVGAMFEEAKSFVLPAAVAGLRTARALHQERAGAEVVVVGHTDTEGQPDDNATLSVARAQSVGALLRGDVAVWLASYEGSGVGVWGAAEDDAMATALGHASFAAFGGGRSQLIEAYFAHAAAGLPAGVAVKTVGAGESFLAVPTPDDTPEPANRRVELFLFDTEAEPAPPGPVLSKSDGVYETWSAGMSRTVEVDVLSGAVTDPPGGSDGGLDAGPEEPPDPDLTTSEASTDDPQLRTEIVRSEVVTVFDVDEVDHYRFGAVAQTRSFAVAGQSGDSSAPFSIEALRGMGGGELLSHGRTYFFDDAVSGPFGGEASGTPAGIGRTGLVHSSHAAAFSEAQLEADFGGDAQAKTLLDESPYVRDAGLYWAPSGTTEHDPGRFFVGVRSFDAFGNEASATYDEDVYFVTSSTNAAGNTVTSEFDPRTLAATRVVDENGVETHARFDALGRLTKTWTFGLEGEGSSEKNPAAQYEYDLEARPIKVTVHSRHEHAKLRKTPRLDAITPSSHVHTSVTYYSGSGAVLQTRVKCEGALFRAGGQSRVGNKGQTLEGFDPTHGGAGYAFDTSGDPVKKVHYDDLGRPIRVVYRDGTQTRTELDAWGQVVFDRNDTAAEVEYEGELDAREKADLALHANTGSHVRLDVLGRPYATFAELKDDRQHRMVVTRTHFDAAGNAIETIDAAGRVAEKRRFGLGGLQISARSVDGGVQASLPNVDGSVLYARRGRVGAGHGVFSRYDKLRRPVSDLVLRDGENEKNAAVVTHRVWAESLKPPTEGEEATSPLSYHKGRLVRVYDGGGLQKIVSYDHRGGVEVSVRTLPKDPKTRPDWRVLLECETEAALDEAAADLLEADQHYESKTEYDAQGRVVQEENPHGARHVYAYTEEGRLKQVSRVPFSLDEEPKPEVIEEVEGYDVFGRPTAVTRGKAKTTYTYDAATQRLTSMKTKAGGKTLQALSYVYDAAGNIVRIGDGAHAKVTTGGETVEAQTRYRYDSLYRLVEASGREHHGQLPGGGSPGRGPADTVAQRVSAPNDVTAVRNYTQRYRYDEHGNLLELRHQLAAQHSASAWTRRSAYSEYGNRLRTSAVGKTETPEVYPHDELGRMQLPHLDEMEYDEFDQLRRVRRGTMEVFFQYVGAQRIRKLTVKGGRSEERRYVGGVEEYRAFVGSDPFDLEKTDELTFTEHAPGGLTLDVKKRRERKAVKDAKPLYRYALGNHLGSTSLEVDEDGKVVSYEEYHPYGTTAYRAVRGDVDVDVNRYRFTGMERDEETGLAQHGWRYFASWLGRWGSADPIGLGDGVNRYAYCGGNPVGLVDRAGQAGALASISALKSVMAAVDEESPSEADLAVMSDDEVLLHPKYVDNLITGVSYHPQAGWAKVHYAVGEPLLLDLGEVMPELLHQRDRAYGRALTRAQTASFGGPRKADEPTPLGPIVVDDASGRVMPAELSLEGTPILASMLLEGHDRDREWIESFSRAGVSIYEDLSWLEIPGALRLFPRAALSAKSKVLGRFANKTRMGAAPSIAARAPKVAGRAPAAAKLPNPGSRSGAAKGGGGVSARFVTNPAGVSLDLHTFQGLTRNPGTITVGRSGAGRALTGPANSYSVTSGGHRLVYGPEGRLMYDVSRGRIKAFQWNQAPNGKWFPRTGSDLKFPEVPQVVLDTLGF